MVFESPYGQADDQSASYFCGLQEGLAIGCNTTGVNGIGQVTISNIFETGGLIRIYKDVGYTNYETMELEYTSMDTGNGANYDKRYIPKEIGIGYFTGLFGGCGAVEFVTDVVDSKGNTFSGFLITLSTGVCFIKTRIVTDDNNAEWFDMSDFGVKRFSKDKSSLSQFSLTGTTSEELLNCITYSDHNCKITIYKGQFGASGNIFIKKTSNQSFDARNCFLGLVDNSDYFITCGNSSHEGGLHAYYFNDSNALTAISSSSSCYGPNASNLSLKLNAIVPPPTAENASVLGITSFMLNYGDADNPQVGRMLNGHGNLPSIFAIGEITSETGLYVIKIPNTTGTVDAANLIIAISGETEITQTE